MPDELASPRLKLVYLALVFCEGAMATDLQRSLGLSKLTLLPILAMVRADGHIQRTADGYMIT
ncbi:MarR family transcriptional regulator [Saliphagus sp. LR7]|uniref:MarR family transcriptional regulator n=1 Tax=Saliphagus sp. LR7 TaxID=2282654 RepID=UPI001E65B8DA|nr:MarR family transcriptional regulator [Saliphagus sp. LR7]